MRHLTILDKLICLAALILSYSLFSGSINSIPAVSKTERKEKKETTETVIQEPEKETQKSETEKQKQKTEAQKPKTASEEVQVQEDAAISYPKPAIEKFYGNELLGEIKAGGLTFAVYDNGAEVTGGYIDDGNFVIPETVDYEGESYEVKAIADQAFSYDALVYSLIIPDTVTTVGTCAVKECKFLISVYISENLTYVGRGSFAGNGGAQLFIPPSVYETGEGAFENNYGEAVITDRNQYQHLLEQNPYMQARVEENVSQQEVYDAHREAYESQQ